MVNKNSMDIPKDLRSKTQSIVSNYIRENNIKMSQEEIDKIISEEWEDLKKEQGFVINKNLTEEVNELDLIDVIRELVKNTPNDMDLGAEVRRLIYTQSITK